MLFVTETIFIIMRLRFALIGPRHRFTTERIDSPENDRNGGKPSDPIASARYVIFIKNAQAIASGAKLASQLIECLLMNKLIISVLCFDSWFGLVWRGIYLPI